MLSWKEVTAIDRETWRIYSRWRGYYKNFKVQFSEFPEKLTTGKRLSNAHKHFKIQGNWQGSGTSHLLGWNAKENVKNHLVTPILPVFQSLELKHDVYPNSSLAFFFKSNSLSRKFLHFSYLNAWAPAPKNLRSPSSYKGSSRVHLHSPSHLGFKPPKPWGAPVTFPI